MTHPIRTALLITAIIHIAPMYIGLFIWDVIGVDIVNELMKTL